MAWQQSDLDTIDKAIASGVKSITFADGRKTEYQNVEQMLGARKVIATALQMQADTIAGRRRNHNPVFRTGL